MSDGTHAITDIWGWGSYLCKCGAAWLTFANRCSAAPVPAKEN